MKLAFLRMTAPALLALVASWVPPFAAAAPLGKADTATYETAFAAIERDEWPTAKRLAAQAEDGLLAKVIDWMDFQRPDSGASFEAISGFVDANPGWPRLVTLRRQAEAVADVVHDPAMLLAWFEPRPPLTGRGALAFARAQAAASALDSAFVRDAWRRLDFTAQDGKVFAREFRGQLRAEDHTARLDRLLWEDKTGPARRMLRRVDRDTAALGFARLALMRQEPGVDGAIAAVPAALRDDPALWYERLRWRRRKGLDESARDLLTSPPGDLVRPVRWAVERRILARRAIATGHFSEARRVAADHGLDSGAAFADAEFLAGWVGLVFLQENIQALGHFSTLYQNVRFPISRARGAYWSGRAAAAANDGEAAASWYAAAAAHPDTFYGQLALAALDRPLPPPPLAPVPSRAARASYLNQELAAAAQQLHQVGQGDRTRPFLIHLMDLAETPADLVMLAQLAAGIERRREAIQVAKRAAGRGLPMGTLAFPVRPLSSPPRNGVDAPEPALVLAIIRQESGFDSGATSSAGARGMMQLLPSTARHVARTTGVAYSRARLLEDPDYNIGLGQIYLAGLLERFEGSYPLALAAYNAGPNRVARWLRSYGDPRAGEIDMIDWIESIPFGETRNYVQRVIEAVPVYRRVLGTTQVAATGSLPF